MTELPVDHAGLETLPFDACLDLLGSVPLGRVGFYADGEVVILPVNHAMDGQDVVFRTAPGSLLTSASEQGPVTFEADQFDTRTRAGWSVLVTGRAIPVYDDTEIRQPGAAWPGTVAERRRARVLDPDPAHLHHRPPHPELSHWRSRP